MDVENIWRFIKIIILTSLVLYLLLFLFLYIFQSKFIYFPFKELSTTPESLGLEYEDVIFNSSDGLKLHGWFIPKENHRCVLLFCHGNAGNISHRLDSIEIFNRLGMSVFIFDYNGYGKSSGKPSEDNTYKSAESAWNYLINKKHIKPNDIILFGRSLGGSIATWLAMNHTPKALIIESTFTSMKELASRFYIFMPVRLLLRYNYNTIGYLKTVKAPVMVIHSRDDELVPFNHAIELYDAANTPKDFLEITGDHNEGFMISGNLYIKGLKKFLDRIN